jgi:hypothetical protein
MDQLFGGGHIIKFITVQQENFMSIEFKSNCENLRLLAAVIKH